MKARSFLVLVAVLGLLVPGFASADKFQSFIGDTTGAPTWFRPIGDGPGISANSSRYRVQSFLLIDQATCVINSGQDYDGYIHLYQGGFSPTNQLINLVDGDDDAELSVGTSRIPADLTQNSILLPAGNYFLVTSGFSINEFGAFQNLVRCNDPLSGAIVQPLHGSCPQYFTNPGIEQQVCLQDQFVVAIEWATNNNMGFATPVRTGSSDTAIFWFFNGRNWEVMGKIINACNFNGHFWFFGGALTNQEYTISVGNALTGQINNYFNPLGNRAAAIADTAAFPCP